MIFQLFVVDDIIGFVLLIGIALLLTFLSKVDLFKGFICYCLIVAPFLFKAGYIDLWVIILLMIMMVYIIITSINSRKRGF